MLDAAKQRVPNPMPADNDQVVATPTEPTSIDDSLGLTRSGLLERDWQKALVIMLTLLVGVALTWVVWQAISPILHTIGLFIVGALLAFALSGPVEALSRRVGNRASAVAAVYVLGGGLVIAGILLLADPLVHQAGGLAAVLPQYANDLVARAPEVQNTLAQYGIHVDVEQLAARAASAVQQGAGDVLGSLVGTVAGVGVLVVDVVLALVISVYFVVDGSRMVDRGLRLLSPRDRARAVVLKDNAARVFGSYLRSQLTLALIVGVGATIGTAALGLPYALVLGVLAGLFELVPMVGSTLSAVPALLVALSMPFPTVLWVLLYFVVLQQIEDHILAPRISGQAVGLHPLGAMFALLAGVQIAGVVGGLVAVPLAGLLWALLGGSLERRTD